jgi:hypothetical protein
MPLPALARSLELAERVTTTLVAAASSFGLLSGIGEGAGVELTPSGRALLLADSPRHAGSLLDLGVSFHRREYGYDRLARALRGRNESEGSWTETVLAPDRVRTFVRAMHAHSVAPAAVWPRVVSLAEHRRLLDVAGGAGTHAIAAAVAYPHLEAVVLELPPVCPWTEAEVAGRALDDRIAVVAGDMWTEEWPVADLHFLSDVLHDWSPERCRRLLERSFAALPAGGRVLLHEMLLDDDRLGPPAVVASDLAMLLVNGGQQYTRKELFAMLREVGFVELRHVQVLGDWHLVGGRRP